MIHPVPRVAGARSAWLLAWLLLVGCSDADVPHGLPAALRAWPAGSDVLEDRGRVVFVEAGCAECHDGRPQAPPGAADLRESGGLRSRGWHAMHLFDPDLARADGGHPPQPDLFEPSEWDFEEPLAAPLPQLTHDGRSLVAYLMRLQRLPARRAHGHSSLPPLGEHWMGPDDLYRMYCSACHGTEGDGDGPGALFLAGEALPRAFRPARFRVRSTPDLPTDDDLLRTLERGLPGTAMPDFPHLSQDDRRVLVEFVKGYARTPAADGRSEDPFAEEPLVPVTIGPAPEPDEPLLARGGELLVSLRCTECHGDDLRGRTAAALGLEWLDEVGRPLPLATDLLAAPFKGGDEPADLYRLLMVGQGGSPMPSYADALPDERDRWALVWALVSRRQAWAAHAR